MKGLAEKKLAFCHIALLGEEEEEETNKLINIAKLAIVLFAQLIRVGRP
jgi:hypothetical protein